LALPDLVHVATFGGNVDVDVATDAVNGEPRESLEVTGFDCEDERGLDGEVEARVVKVDEFVRVGALVKTVGDGGGGRRGRGAGAVWETVNSSRWVG
jgi:hypothetical protein